MTGHYFTDTWVRETTGRHRTTVKRWRDNDRFPKELEQLARLKLDGELGLISEQWAGWHLDPRSHRITTPGGNEFSPGEVEAIQLLHQQLTEHTRIQNALRAAERDLSRPLRAILLRLARRLLSAGPRAARHSEH